MLIANFQVFIEILAAHQTYQPNEEDLKIASLNCKLEDLMLKSEAVTIAQTNADIARSNRNNLLYDKGTGLVDVSSGVKNYIRAAFSPNTPNYKPLLSLEFRKPKT